MNHPAASFAALMCLNLAVASAQDMPAHHAHAPAADGRAILALSPGERVMVLEEMRLFLDGVEKMTGALGRQDMQATADAARGMGMRMAHEMPPGLRAKLPMEFRQLGFSVHRDFDQIAMDAESLKDVSYSLNQLSATLQKCVSCHAAYQIRSPLNGNPH
jgi:cytochrome c553